MMSRVYKVMFQKDFNMVGEDFKVSIDFVEKKIKKKFDPKNRHEVFTLLEYLINKITNEIGFDHNNT